MALITTLNEEPTGAFAATLPILALPLHAACLAAVSNSKLF